MDTAAQSFDDLRLLTATDLAELWKVDPSTIYRLIKTGALPSVRVGNNSVRVTVADAQAYMRRHTQPAPEVIRVDGWNCFPALNLEEKIIERSVVLQADTQPNQV